MDKEKEHLKAQIAKLQEKLAQKNDEEKLQKQNEFLTIAKQKAEESELMYRSFIENFQGIAFKSGVNWHPEYFNGAVKEMTGYEANDFLTNKLKWKDIIHPNDLPGLLQENVQNPGYKAEREYRIITKSGKVSWVHDYVQSFRNEKNGNIYLYGAIYDISVRKNAEIELDEQRKTNESIIKAAAVGLSYVRKRKIIWANHAMEQMFGYSPEEYMNQDMRMLFASDEEYERAGEIVYKKMDKNNPIQYETTYQKKDGSLMHCVAKVNFLEPENPEKGVLASIFDITELLKSKAELKKRNEELKIAKKQAEESTYKYHKLFDSANDAIFLADSETGLILEANKKAEQITGKTRHELIGMHHSKLHPAHQEKDTKLAFELDAKTIKDDNRYQDYYLLGTDNKNIPVEISPCVVEIGGRKVVMGIFRDITEPVKTKEELIAAKEKAEESNRLKTAFLNNISHEFRTPMNAIVGFAELMLNDDNNAEDYKRYARLVHNSSSKLLDIVTDTVEISRVKSQSIKFSPKKFNLKHIFDDILTNAREKITGKEIRFIVNINCPKEKLFIYNDSHLISRSLKHILDNAIKFTRTGFVKFSCQIKKDEIEIEIQDTGIGIPAEMQSIIFQPFTQLEDAAARNYGGNGIGLALVKAYVEMAGGEIHLESAPGHGTKVKVTIPGDPEVHEAENNHLHQNERKMNWEGRTILVVEDEQVNQQLLQEFLQETKANVVHAKDGREALDKCKLLKEIDLVLMDIKMPVMDGIESTQLIKKERPQIPVIAQTAYSMPEDKSQIEQAGCDAVFVKPLRKNMLFEAIDQLLNKKEN